MRRRLVAAVCLCVLVALGPSAGAQQPDTVVVGLLSEPDHLLPQFSRLAVSGHVAQALFVGMVGLNADWQVYPRLAREVPSIENGQWKLLPGDEMELTFRLRPGFKWHDGTAVTAGDIVFAWEVARHPGAGAVSPHPGISGMTAPDEGTLVVRWRERQANANLFGHPALPRHLLESQFRENPAAIRSGGYAARPVGNGPYRFVEWVKGQRVRLAAFSDFAEGRPSIPNLEFRFFGSQADARTAQVHVNFTGVGGGPEYEAIQMPGLIFEHIALNLESPRLQDRRVRQALLLSVDRETIRRQQELAHNEVAHSWLPPRHPFHHNGIRRYEANQDAAKRLLAEAGWTPGTDGVLRNSAGDRLELVLMTTPGNAIRERTQDLLIAQWRSVGISVRKDNPSNFFDVLGRRQFPHMAMFAWVFTPLSSGFEIWHSSMVPRAENSFQGTNYYGWRHGENDQILSQAGRELDATRRAELYRRQQEIWAEELPAIPLWVRGEVAYVHLSIRGVKPTSIGGGYTWNVHEWAWRP